MDFAGLSLAAERGEPFDATVRGRVMGRRKSLGNAVVVGDRVRLAWEGGRAVVVGVEPRRNAFSRRAAGGRDEEQVVAANLDQVVIVTALRRPEFRHGFVDRVLVQSLVAGLPALLALNKTDLGDSREAEALLADYAPAGVPGLQLCAKSGRGVEALREACRGRRSLFVGHSGVGKSTLLDRLAPGHELLAAEVNERTGKGRHTTTAALLLRPAPDLELIDTPGVRAFALWGVDAGTLAEYYPEFGSLRADCRFADCRHDREPGCAVRAAVERGLVHEHRLASFRKLREELEGGRW
ncbi:MAG: ribosome small subunit-dependent GTPase A [Candidatus Eisenbacteria bacterium]|nr:ribosome small subunit-dependent GTPase A [Candidatus Eisenbacteria bacterium]